MKKSDYEHQRRRHYEDLLTRRDTRQTEKAPSDVDAAVQADVRAAEAAGIVWDGEVHEGAELPARVQLTETGDHTTEYMVEALDRTYAVAAVPSNWKRRQERIDILRAMVDAYNLWGPHGACMDTLRQALGSYYANASALQHAIGRLIHEAQNSERARGRADG